jgi:hypothetical protein
VLHAVGGDEQTALAKLREILQNNGPLCLPCLQETPTLDALRGNPEFESLLADLRERRVRQGEGLKGVLLPPAQANEVDLAGFDPFVSTG